MHYIMQKLVVKEAAKRAMPDTKVVDEELFKSVSMIDIPFKTLILTIECNFATELHFFLYIFVDKFTNLTIQLHRNEENCSPPHPFGNGLQRMRTFT